MSQLILDAGPSLRYCRWDSDAEPPADAERDVTELAEQYLFESVKLGAGVTLATLFALLEASPVLKRVLRRNFVDEWCAEAARLMGTGAVAERSGYSPDAIEYLELYQSWSYDSGARSYSSLNRWDFHGIGYELREDAPEHYRKKGERVQWGVCGASLAELLALPLRVNAEASICEDDVNTRAYGALRETVRHEHITLGQLLEGVLWELSFFGAPEDASAVTQDLKERVESIDNGTAELVSGDDFFDTLERPGIAKMFTTLGAASARDVARTLRELEDDVNAAAELEQAYPGQAVVRDEYRGLSAYEFRKAYNSAD